MHLITNSKIPHAFRFYRFFEEQYQKGKQKLLQPTTQPTLNHTKVIKMWLLLGTISNAENYCSIDINKHAELELGNFARRCCTQHKVEIEEIFGIENSCIAKLIISLLRRGGTSFSFNDTNFGFKKKLIFWKGCPAWKIVYGDTYKIALVLRINLRRGKPSLNSEYVQITQF